MPPLQTERLTLIPFTLELAEATLYNRSKIHQLLGVYVPDNWPQPDYAEIMPMIVEGRRKDPSSAEWIRMIVHTADHIIIGDIGFIEPPDTEGNVEFGYSIVPEYRGKGYATEAARAIIEWAFEQPGVRRVIADCLNDNFASIRVLEKAGMQEIEPEGDLLQWERLKLNRND
ncbi:MAG: GNAT family N-acetyltransferase [Chloroflexia bacterium]